MQQNAFLLKIAVYGVALILIAWALYLIGQPSRAVVHPGGETTFRAGGVLSQIRIEQELAESQLGEIDPASSTVKLATFGMRGVAIALLWYRCQEYQKRFDWNNVIATSNQLVFLEPHFTTIWEYLGWNLAYNASSEFDDYRERYRWVIRGIDFLIRGVDFNRRAPKLCKATGWTISQKIGIADENYQYRRLLREDDDFWQRHDKLKLPSERDNWILGRRWYHQGEDLVRQGVSIGNESDFLFFANSRYNLFNYASWKRKDGIFGEEATLAWDNAGREWSEFAKMDLSTAIPVDGTLRMKPGVEAKRATLETTDLVRREKEELVQELDDIAPGLRKTLCLARWKELAETPGQQGALLTELTGEKKLRPPDVDVPEGEEELDIIRQWLEENEPDWRKKLQDDLNALYTPEELKIVEDGMPPMFMDEDERDRFNKIQSSVQQVRGRAFEMIKVGPRMLTQEIQDMDLPREKKARARTIAGEFDGFKEKTRLSDLYRDILNFDFRFREVAVERTHEVDEARRNRYIGRIAYYDGRIADSVRDWYAAMDWWKKLFDKPEFAYVESDVQFMRDIMDLVERFVIILDNSNEIFKPEFGLQGMIRSKLRDESGLDDILNAFEYAKKTFEKGDFENAEKYLAILAPRFEDLNRAFEYMKLAPLSEVRDRVVETNALYLKALKAQNKPLPDPLPLRSFVELMIKHDSMIDQADELAKNGLVLLRDRKGAEAQAEFDRAAGLWLKILDKYPLIPEDPTLSANADLRRLAGFYSEALKLQEKPMPEDFPLKRFLQ